MFMHNGRKHEYALFLLQGGHKFPAIELLLQAYHTFAAKALGSGIHMNGFSVLAHITSKDLILQNSTSSVLADPARWLK